MSQLSGNTQFHANYAEIFGEIFRTTYRTKTSTLSAFPRIWIHSARRSIARTTRRNRTHVRACHGRSTLINAWNSWCRGEWRLFRVSMWIFRGVTGVRRVQSFQRRHDGPLSPGRQRRAHHIVTRRAADLTSRVPAARSTWRERRATLSSRLRPNSRFTARRYLPIEKSQRRQSVFESQDCRASD